MHGVGANTLTPLSIEALTLEAYGWCREYPHTGRATLWTLRVWCFCNAILPAELMALRAFEVIDRQLVPVCLGITRRPTPQHATKEPLGDVHVEPPKLSYIDSKGIKGSKSILIRLFLF